MLQTGRAYSSGVSVTLTVSEMELPHVVLQADICCVHNVLSCIRGSSNVCTVCRVTAVLGKLRYRGKHREGISVVVMKEFIR